MKNIQRLAVIYVITTMSYVTLPAASAEGSAALDISNKAAECIDLLTKGEFAKVVENFDATMKAALPAGRLAETWNSLIAQVGSLKKRGRVRMENEQGMDVVYVTCEFEIYPLDVKFVFDGDGSISGLWFVPVQAPAVYEPPSYADEESFDERECTVGSGKWKLPGTLTLPKDGGGHPAVILLHGSGPQDRNESIGPNKPFVDLAWGLATNGIAVLRYEKRTKHHGIDLMPLRDSVTVKEETIDDALAAVDLLLDVKQVDPERIFVLGHSLGGMLIPRIALRDSRIAGFVLLAAPARPLEDAIVEQMTYLFQLDGNLTKTEQEELTRITVQAARVKEAGLSVDTPADDLPLGVSARYWLDLRGYDPVEAALRVNKPMFILQGERDYQVTMEDFDRWRKASLSRNNMNCKSYPSLNHLFMDGKGKSSPDEYERPGHVAGGVIQDIGSWIKAH